MKSLIATATGKLQKWSPVTITIAGLLYELALGALDFTTPEEMSFTIFYLLGVAFVAWGGGTRPALLVSAVSAVLMAMHDREALGSPRIGNGVLAWNASTRFLLFCASGWLAAEITRLNRHLQSLVISRTRELESETEKHKATSAELGQALSRLQAIISQAPIIIFAVDRSGVIQFEQGRALASLGARPGEHVGQNVMAAYPNSRQLPQHVRRALAGEEFSAPLEIGKVALETWYTPIRESDGSLAGYTGVALNVSDQRRLESQILEISDREQARIGQEIHDGLCQQLVSLAFDANSLQSDLAVKRLPEARTAKRLADYLDQAITEARQLARGLFPIRLEALGLGPALEELARTTRERFGIACDFESSQAIQLGSTVMATHLYRIAQEAITNAIKHGNPRSILLRLEADTAGIQLGVQDDGHGLKSDLLKQSRGMGLHIMDYRARAIGGTFSFRAGAAGGTVVSCCVPQPVH